jgi:multisubunit Na+/H+ antiporter MnhE subunit
MVPLAHNVFSFESRGIQLLLLAPVPFREVLVAKNLTLGALVGAQSLVVYLLIQAIFGGQQTVIVAATFVALAFGLLVHFTVGNILSLYYPRAMDFNQFKQRQSGISVLIGIGTQIVLFALIYGIFAVARWWGNLWLALVAYATLTAAALQVYWLTLEFCERLAARRREVLITEICRE